MSEFTKLGGYLVEGQPEVAHDSALSGNGLPESPLGISEQFITDVVRPNTQSAMNLNIGHPTDNTVSQVGTTIGAFNNANNTGMAVGTSASAFNRSIAVGDNVYANNIGIAVGYGVKANNIAAFGTYNSETNTDHDCIFVVGNGTDSANRSDAFKIMKDGRVEAGDFVTPNNVQLSALTGVLKETGFEYDSNNKISGYNGSGFAGGGSFPASAEEACEAVTANSASWNSVTAKLDTTAFSDVSGTFLTAHQDLSDYQTTAGMTAYQPAGDYLTAIPDTYLQNTDLSTEDGKVTAISGIPLSAGGDVPEGVMVESGLEYNAVQEISGYNGSAIAQYGAEKQWLTHDDTIVHISNSAQYAFGVNLSGISADLARMMGVDETVLWTGARQTTGTIQLSESMWNYNEMAIYVCPDYNTYSSRMGYQISRHTVIPQTDANEQLLCYAKSDRIASNTYLSELFYLRFNPDGNSVDFSPGIKWSNNTVTTGATAFTGAVTKIVGIGRKN